MPATVEAVHEHGVLRLLEPLALGEGERVRVTVLPALHLTAPDPRRAAAMLAEIAAMPLEGPKDGFSGADHDAVLYGKDHGA